MQSIIRSILDSDLYKFSMQNFVIQHYPETVAVYKFLNRDKSIKFNREAFRALKSNIEEMCELRLSDAEYDWMKEKLYFLPASYRQYLAAYRFNPAQVSLDYKNGELDITIKGKWRDTILWEVPLMAIISEVYFREKDTDWNMDGQAELANKKAAALSDAGCVFTDFGARRRRNFETQDIVVREMSRYDGFAGTSNCYLAMKYNIRALGTCAHEVIGAVAALESLNHPNRIFMEKWAATYKGDLGTMLPDTFGTGSFFRDFSTDKAKMWDGVRHDSGDPYVFADKICSHYRSKRIDPGTKTIIFSNGLDVATAIDLNNYCKGKIRCSFGIGTNFTSDFMKVSKPAEKSRPVNIVIKMTGIDGIPVVKLSDEPGKVMGDPKMVGIMKYIHTANYSDQPIYVLP